MNNGWKVAMGLLAYERGASTLGQQFGFTREFGDLTALAAATGRDQDPVWRQRLASLHSRLEIMRWNSLRMLTTADQPELSGASYISKLYWARLHRDIGETWVDLAGEAALAFEPTAAELDATDGGEAYPLTDAQRLFLYTRSDTIYGGANQIQRNIIGERALGLPPEPKVTV